jgi:lysophospholipase L1-like esterase
MRDGYVPGTTVADRAGTIAAEIAALAPVQNMRFILVNLGANDVSALPAEAVWQANLATVLDAMNVAYPVAKVYVMRPWRRGYAAECNTVATRIGNVLATRGAWAFVGPDERVFLENGDDGVTYTADGIHPNTAGYALTAAQWKTALGY